MSVGSQWEGGEGGQFTHVAACWMGRSLPACWTGRRGEDWLEECPHLGSSPPFPNLIVQSNEPNPLPGSFAFIENYSELTLRRRRICKWAKLTRIGLDRAFWSSYLEYLKEGGGEAAVRQGAYFTKLFQCLKGEEKRFILIPSCRNSLNDSLFQNWYKVAFFVIFTTCTGAPATFWEKTDSAKVPNFRLKLLCRQKITPELSQIQYSTATLLTSWLCFHSFVLFIVFPQSSQKYLSRQ